MIGSSIAWAAIMLAGVTACTSGVPQNGAARRVGASASTNPGFETETATPAAPTSAHPHPTVAPCAYPTDRTQPESVAAFSSLLEESDFVVEADIETKFQRRMGSQVFWAQVVDNVVVLRSRVAPTPPLLGVNAESDPGKPPYAWRPGRYLLLLLAGADGISSPTGGMWGMFR
ncbi:MAG: hypothetical protein QOJ62_2244, partial [Actinomycetota bacterium]|nr:hypothetical protein [Actinomycetota bacterium]